jgi:tRNA(Glu) U13 pseudouridine synthase TruD
MGVSSRRDSMWRCRDLQNLTIALFLYMADHFEITMRNMMRVKQFHVEGTQTWKEQKVPLRSSHLDAMVKRITQFGFINFFGEQRVGDAGSRSHVGVRSYDFGREMLKFDFSEAINLIMTGRSNRVYSPGPEEINARQVWKSSGGNARQTLKSFPTNRNTMVRERDLMKGLLRYGDPLAALRCIPHNVRMFWIHAYQVRHQSIGHLTQSQYFTMVHPPFSHMFGTG